MPESTMTMKRMPAPRFSLAQRSVLILGSLVVMTAWVPPRLEAQTIARRVAGAPDGKVRFSFAARPDLCGYEGSISRGKNNNISNWSSKASEDVEYDRECSVGPVRIVGEVRRGSLTRIKTYVGGRWRPASGVTDLGTVSAKDGTDFLLGVASTETGKVAGEAIYPTTLADSVVVAPSIFRIARNASRPTEVREQAIFWLSQLPDENAVDMLSEILNSASEEKLRDKAIFALSQHHSGRGAAVLRDFVNNERASSHLRAQAVFWLGQSRSGGSVAFLKTLYTRTTNAEIKDKILFSLSQQRGVGNEKWLMDVAANSSESMELRKKALFWAGQSGTDIDELTALYSRMPDREMKEQMIFVLSQRQSGAAAGKLMDIAKNDSDRELRRKALFWLGQSRDPRVQDFLTELINR
ncbi:MAG: HEAT repeat domain-containing protein [Gemmatimonadota bacterium]|nr:HEAT repeat domain-containing protein [Gemmatimonadota bacterium]